MKTVAIKIEGQILSPEVLDRIESGDIKGQTSADFGFTKNEKVKDRIQLAWADAKDQWNIFRRRTANLSETDYGTTETRKYWMKPFLENLGYVLTDSKASAVINGDTFAISHRASNLGDFPVHITGINDSLDKRRETGGLRLSPHALLQEYLNRTDEYLYGLVTNGYQLRLLRDSGKLIKLSYLEFDLFRMLEDDLYAEFSIMYRLIHSSRMPKREDENETSLFENYHQDSLEAGSRIREKLSQAVEKSILLIGNGFLKHPSNTELRERLLNKSLPEEDYYKYLLRFIYRILFLLVIEERDIVYPEELPQEKKKLRDIYFNYYSVSRIRALSEKFFLFDENLEDAWISLRNTFKFFGSEFLASKLGIYPLSGDLFDPGGIGILENCSLDNHTLLKCLKNLSEFEHKSTRNVIKVNYAALNVEEFGSVYEGLLEKDPKVNIQGNSLSFTFVAGSERSSSGSHYTPEELVQPLIKHSLDYVIADRLEVAGKVASGEWRVVNGEWRAESREWRAVNGEIEIGNVKLNLKEVVFNAYLSGPGSLEKGSGYLGKSLSDDQTVSERGIVRDDFADETGSSIGSGESGGRMGTADNKGISPVYKNGKRESERTGDKRFDSAAGRITDKSGSGEFAERMLDIRKADDSIAKKVKIEVEIVEWWNSLKVSARRSLLSAHLLLSIKVCDVACGSGHILLSASRRIAQTLATVRTGEDQPSPEPYRNAVRDVITNCIYGVDKNPLAVELCKVALWLEAHNPGMPLNFLDNKIRCGDSIVGLARIEELQNGISEEAFKAMPGDDKKTSSDLKKLNKNERNSRKQILTTDTQEIVNNLNNISATYKNFNSLPDKTVEDIKNKKKKYEELRGHDWFKLRELADMQVAQFFIPKTENEKDFLTTDADYFRIYAGHKSEVNLRKISKAMSVSAEKKFFHWFLEFPEVMQEGGFDCILGNPPFLGGQRLSGTFGDDFLNWVKTEFAPAGSCDLVTYFFRRIYKLLTKGGYQALLATNTIAQGAAREGGLDVIAADNGTINFAIRSTKWPGVAAVEVALVAIHNGKFVKNFYIGNKKVDYISPYLDDAKMLGNPYPLKQNEGKSFQGSIVLGKGFILTPQEAQRLIVKNPKNKDVLFPYLNGEDLNTNFDQSPSRWVVNFFDWEEDYCRRNYPECFEIVERLVKPERTINNDRVAREKWWQFLRPRPELYKTIAGMEREWCRYG